MLKLNPPYQIIHAGGEVGLHIATLVVTKESETEDETNEVVANCDHPDEVIANCDNLRSLKFYPSLPYAYTEQGIGQLSAVVHSKIAIERSIMIMNAFVAMRRFMVQNAGILMRIAHLEKHQIETDQKMDMLLDRMDKQSPETILQLLK